MESTATALIIACAIVSVGSTQAGMTSQQSSSLHVTTEASGTAQKPPAFSAGHQLTAGNPVHLSKIKMPGPPHLPTCRTGLQGPCIQPRATCNATEVFECYQQFTSETLTELFDIDSYISNSSVPPRFEMCRPDCVISSCKADIYENCVADVSKYHYTELAYRSQRNIFCSQKKLKEYLTEYKCLEQDERQTTCLRQTAKNGSAGDGLDSNHSSPCSLALSQLECANLPSSCTSGDVSLHREVRVNDARLGGCIPSQPHRSSAPDARARRWLIVTALCIVSLSSLTEVALTRD
ncbi:hypothetical protein V5799_031738 [Amblyomma americanum]|uniref:Secreted protein n=1 Tax=Amblyomma americanum TaxID=6943 RepID=A0AAQ4DT63_AMBAM